MSKRKMDWQLPPIPLPVALLGATVSGKPNFFTIAWFTMLQDSPALIGAVMSRERHTKKGILENGTFSINLPSTEMAALVDYCGIHSGSVVDKQHLFDVFYGDLMTAPMARECVVNLECRLHSATEFRSTALIIGEIVAMYGDEACLAEERPDVHKMDPMIFFMPDGPYLKVGDSIAEAYDVGKTYRPPAAG